MDSDTTNPNSRPCSKKIVVCCDGTGYREHSGTLITNVSRISRCIRPFHKEAEVPQVVYYQSGVGTETWTLSSLFRQAFGKGIHERIMEAYSFICHNYHCENDEIYLIGYSRGAFTARCIAHLIHDVGLLKKSGLYHLPKVFSLWKGHDGNWKTEIDGLLNTDSGNGQSPQSLLRKDIRIKVCALWDTVSSLGFPWPAWLWWLQWPAWLQWPVTGNMKFVDSDLCPSIEHAFQALSLQERRHHFLPIVWKLPAQHPTLGEKRVLEQCWFLGYHGDIGGGNQEESLAQFALVWILSKLKGYLDFDEENIWKPASETSNWTWMQPIDQKEAKVKVNATVKDSFRGIFTLGGSTHRKPRKHFWCPSHGEYKHDDFVSYEGIHVTVRILRELKAAPPCALLKEYESGSWNITDTVGIYNVEESKWNNTELHLLRRWLDQEATIVQKMGKEKIGNNGENKGSKVENEESNTLVALLLAKVQELLSVKSLRQELLSVKPPRQDADCSLRVEL
ncbi:hypothetical protein FGG08_003777 [Glutinoglossum americanum]|uniref:T6SS Phospholipase effector Tle1-like catalytic domain-containing protein n=1 Tax=Glutinoglossum americanum TaxID=1670608 RepID=A0A9P8I1S8_9PEZI|nr:hypothetical protein FGG08_003777 [Glutinoglossum americanum]